MILTDAGPLVALLDRDDIGHDRCKLALPGLSQPMVTTWPAFAEAMYILGDRTGWPGQEKLWTLVLTGRLEVRVPDASQMRFTHELMAKYRDRPMDLADATLVVLAEQLGLDRIFTLDADFTIYRTRGKRPFVTVP